MRDLKYMAAFSIPLIAFLSLYFEGVFVWATVIYAFCIIPLLELTLPIDSSNIESPKTDSLLKRKLFDWLLYLNVPLVYGILFYGIYKIVSYPLTLSEFAGIVFSVGIVLGVNGINVAHELGHRQHSNERFWGKLLLLPSLYMHFYIEHNFGHHLNAATPEDPATARYNQTVYSFWATSILRQYFKAWSLQQKFLKAKDLGFFSWHNDMFWYSVLQIGYLFVVWGSFGYGVLLFILCAALVGVLLLETVNYIEHYGLLRLKTGSGRYERVKEIHSWNSNHIIGRIVLYELTRHSDHHFKSSKKYQILDCHEDSPQMPYGYPTSMVLALLPPLWFKIMNPRIPKQMLTQN